MSLDDNKALARRFFASLDTAKGGPEASLVAPTYKALIAGHDLPSRDAHDGLAKVFYGAVADLQHSVKEVMAEDNRVAVRFTFVGTHTGDSLGVPPTGKKLSAEGLGLVRIANGKVTDLEVQFDEMGLMRQLGVIK